MLNQIENIQAVLAYYQADKFSLSEEEKRALDEQGFVCFYNLISQDWLNELQQAFDLLLQQEGEAAGSEFEQEQGTDRLSDLANKGRVFDGTYTHPKLLAAVYHILGRDFKVYSINGRAALPGQGHQALHADWGIRQTDELYQIVNSLWLLDDFTAQNGATRLVPGTHRLAGSINDYIADPTADHPEQVLVEAPAGSVVVFNAHLWHGGTINKTLKPRRVLHSSFVSREHLQQLNQRKFIRRSTYERISPAGRYLLDVEN